MADQQPSNIEPYVQPHNPVTRDPLEREAADQVHRHEDSSSTDRAGGVRGRQPQEGVPSSLGRGVQDGSGPVDSQEARSTGVRQTVGQQQEIENENVNVDAEQMATLGEGEVAGAVDRKSGTQQVPGSGPAEAQDFASDLDKKKAEQAAARNEMKEARSEGVDVGGGSGRLGNESLADV